MRINKLRWYVPERTIDEPDPVEEQIQECAAQISAALQFVPHKETRAIQAGGRVGVWPRALAKFFSSVLTYEPDALNFECLEANTREHSNIVALNVALGARRRYHYLRPSPQSSGMSYIATDSEDLSTGGARRVVMTTIDESHDTVAVDVGAIFLDVEGYELEVLKGARRTLELKPVLVIEENNLCRRYGRERGDVQAWLAPLGYRLVHEFTTLPSRLQHDGEFHGSDLIFAVP